MRTLLCTAFLTALLAPALAAQDPCGTWSPVPVAPPPGSIHTVLEDVAVVAADQAWAVGRKYVPVGAGYETQTLAYRWDGASWTIVPTPSPSPYPGGGWSELQAVAAIAPDDVWAAGGQRIQGSGQYPFVGTHVMVQRWNGSTWSLVPTPLLDGSGDYIADVEVVGPDEIWFVGDWQFKQALAMRWNGSGFEVFDLPFLLPDEGHGLTAVSALSSDDVWAVGGGHDEDYTAVSYILHWNGSSWEHRPGPAPGYFHRLFDVEALAPDDVYAIGDYQDAGGYHGLFLHWDGSSWTQLPEPPVGGAALHAFAPDRIYASGAGVALWDGAAWTTVATFPSVGFPSLIALAEIGPCSLWGVGRRIEANVLEPLAVRLEPAGNVANYCVSSPNSVGSGAVIGAGGSTSIAAGDLVFTAQGAPPQQFGIFFYGTQKVALPFGNGTLCVAGSTARLPLLQTTASGTAASPMVYAGSPVAPGQTWNFQFWYRDPAGGGSAVNLSDALEVSFLP